MHPTDEEINKTGREADSLSIPRISASTGALLQFAAALRGARTIVEIGTGNGFSTMFLIRAISANSGRIVTFEKDGERFRAAESNLRPFVSNGMVEIHNCDALEHPELVPEGIDMIFIDAMKRQYGEILKAFFDKLAPGAVICSDDVFFQGVKDPENTLDRHRRIVKGLREYHELLNRMASENLIDNYFLEYENGIAVSIKK